ncbi:MAG: response regulator [Myxococcota bacterium]
MKEVSQSHSPRNLEDPVRRARVAEFRQFAASMKPRLATLSRLAARVTGFEYAFLNLIHKDHLETVAGLGLELGRFSLEESFCAVTFRKPEQVVWASDVLADPDLRAAAQRQAPPLLRAYGGTVLTTREGLVIGTLGVGHSEVRVLTAEQREGLVDVAAEVASALDDTRSRWWLAQAVNRIDDAVVSLDTQGRLLLCNPASHRLLGLPEGEAHERELGGPVGQELLRAVEASMGHSPVELTVGQRQWDVRVGSMAHGAVIWGRDVTERRARDVWLRLLETCVERLNDAVIVAEVTPKGPSNARVVYVNQAYERLTGRSRDEILGKPTSELEESTLDAALIQPIREALQDGRPYRTELAVGLEGEPRWIDLDFVPLPGQGATSTHWIAVGRDNTERRELEERFLRAQRLETFGALAGGVAHDLNNALSPIALVLPHLLAHETDPERRRDLESIGAAAHRGTSMVRQLLSFARGGDGPRQILAVETVLEEVVRVVRDTFPRAIDLTVEIEPKLWPIEGNLVQLHQLFLNLCINARDAMNGAGQLEIKATATEFVEAAEARRWGVQPGAFVRLDVRDSGPGIPVELRKAVFEPFFTTKRPGRGTGLGLSTAQSIAQGHGGRVQILDQDAPGAWIVVLLRATSGTPPPPRAERITQPLPRGNSELVLIIDDEPAVLEVLSRALSRSGYRVLTAQHGGQGLELFRGRAGPEIACVMTDMAMPVLDGAATIARLRALDPLLPIIATSGHAATPDREAALAAGATHFLAKPFSIGSLLPLLREVISDYGAGGSKPPSSSWS